MKIGILTLPLHTNYGGILQAWALQTVLERMGHEVEVLNKKRRIIIDWKHYPVIVAKRLVSRFMLHRYSGPIFIERQVNHERDVIEQYTSDFVKQHIKCHYYRTIDDLVKIDYDAIVVGSDQVWSHIHAGNICGTVINAFLPFTLGKKMIRISYAASFGKDQWEYTDQETCKSKELVKKFDGISVREESAIALCRDKLGVKAACHLDPTLLLNAEDYVKDLAIDKVPHSKGNLLLYIIDNNSNKTKVADAIAMRLKLTPFAVNSRAEDMSGQSFSIEERIQPPVEQWLRGFYDAEFVVTDSFHACVFSILFHKPFIVIGNPDRGMARFENLLSKLNLTSRLVETSSQVDVELINAPIDWDDVHNRLALLRTESENYLKHYL